MTENIRHLTLEAFQDALAKGLGRTYFAVQQPGGPALYADAILDACLHNRQFDAAFEEERSNYLFPLIEAAGIRERVLLAILDALPVSENKRDCGQMMDLLGDYVKQGDERAWDALTDLARVGEGGAEYVLVWSGQKGFDWAVEHLLPHIPEEEHWRLDSWLPSEPADDSTEGQKRLREIVTEARKRMNETFVRPVEPDLTPREFLDGLGGRHLGYEAAKRFIATASEAEMREAAERYLVATDRQALRSLHWVFRQTDFPLPLRVLAPHVDDESRGWSACHILDRYDFPEIRQFGLELLQKRPLPRNALEVLRSSYDPGDEAAIAAILPDVASFDLDERHNFIVDLLALMNGFDDFEGQPFAEWIYEHSPCALCRDSAVRWMVHYGTLPDSVREEGAYDAESGIREFALVGR